MKTLIRIVLCFGMTVGSVAGLAEESIVADLKKNTHFKLFGRTIAYSQELNGGLDYDYSRFEGDVRLEARSGFSLGDHLFGISGWLEYGSQRDTYSQKEYTLGINRVSPEIQRKRRIFELNELYWIFSWGGLDLTLGKKEIRVGLAPLYSPTDRISPVDLNDPLDIKRYGYWQIALDYYRNSTMFSLSILPFFQPPKIPGLNSRWVIGLLRPGLLFPQDFQNLIPLSESNVGFDEDIPEGMDAVQLLARMKTTTRGWDFFFHIFNGISMYPVLRARDPGREESDLVREYIRASTISFGFSTALSDFEFHGEGLFQKSGAQKDDDYFAFITGTTYTPYDLAQKLGVDRIELTVDVAGESLLGRQNHEGFIQSSRSVRFGKGNIISMVLVDLKFDIRLDFLANIDFDDGGNIFAPGVSYRPVEGFWIRASMQFFNGADDNIYGAWKENDRFVLSIEYSF